ncbi:MAG: dipeptidase [Terriglobales bacterium]
MNIPDLLLLSATVLLCATAFAQNADTGPKVSPEARRIQQSAIVIDTHADTPGRFVDENFNPSNDAGKGHWDLAKVKEANLGAEFFSIWVDPKKYQGKYVQRALDMIDSVYETTRKHPDQMMMAYSVSDIERAHQQHKLASLIGLEGGHAIDNNIRILRDYYRLGVRYMTLSWANTNEFADSSGDMDKADVQHHNGLTDFGKQVVLEMNRLGMLVDISHVADKTFWDTLATSKAPVIASHSSSRVVTNHPRNLTDEMLKAVAKNGGVVQVNFNCGFIDQNYLDAYTKWNQQRMAQGKADSTYSTEVTPNIPRPPFKSLIDHFDHIAKVAGVDHVGIGSDFDGVDCLPSGIDSVGDLPKITQALLDRGYSPDDLQKILGGNLLRVFADAERVSRQMQSDSRQQH